MGKVRKFIMNTETIKSISLYDLVEAKKVRKGKPHGYDQFGPFWYAFQFCEEDKFLYLSIRRYDDEKVAVFCGDRNNDVKVCLDGHDILKSTSALEALFKLPRVFRETNGPLNKLKEFGLPEERPGLGPDDEENS